MNKLKGILALVFLMVIAACSSDNPAEENSKNILVNNVIINGSNIEDGASKQLAAVVLPNNATDRTVTWSVSDASIASISSTGLLSPLVNGSVKITVTANDASGISAEKTITISGVKGPQIKVESISISGSDITDGQPKQLTATILPNNANNKVVTWSVSNATLASISTEGLVTPKLNGALTVTATATDGSGKTGEFQMNISGVIPVYATNLKAENMLLWQRSNGGWPKEPYNDFSGYDRVQTAAEITTANNTKNNTDTTIDNNHTVGELKTMLSAYKSTSNPNYLNAVIRAIDYLFEAQYANGGWPQYYPDKSFYRHQITYNDNAMVNVMNLMWDISKSKNNTEVLDPIYINKAIAAFNKGIDVMIQTQITVNGKKTAWCAQHDEVTLLPATARAYELPSNSGSESVGIVRTLMLVENPSAEIIQSVKDAVAWFEEVKIVGYATQNTGSDVVLITSPGNVMWARFYDLDTNLPFFCGRDGIKKNTLAEIELERRTGYAWYGNWPKDVIASEFTAWKTKHGI